MTAKERRIRIAKHKPIPQLARAGRPRKYPLPDMQVGDSFYVEDCSYQTIYACIKKFIKKHQPTFRFVIKKEEPGVRVWRTQ